eukprot:gene1293-11377_t
MKKKKQNIRDLSQNSVVSWTVEEVIFWIQKCEKPSPLYFTKKTISAIENEKIDGRSLVKLINYDKSEKKEENEKKTKMEFWIEFHEYCEKTLLIETFGKRELFYHSICHINIKQFFTEMKIRKNSSGLDLFSSATSSSEQEHDLPTGISRWEENDIETWLNNFLKPNIAKSVLEKLEDEDINGYVLFRIFTYSDDFETQIFTSIGIESTVVKLIIRNVPSLFGLIKIDMAREAEFDFPEESIPVLQKIRQSSILSCRYHLNDPEYIKKIVPLFDAKEMMKVYLDFNYEKVLEKHKEIQLFENSKMFKKKKSIFDVKSNSTEEDEDNLSDFEEIEISPNDTSSSNQDIHASMSVKLVISELRNTSTGRNFVQTISPILDFLHLQPQFGIFHTGLIIGPFLLEWNNGEIAIPRYPTSAHSFLTIDIAEIPISNEEESNEVREKIADFLVHWNVNMKYKNRSNDLSKEGNCQHFVEALLKKLGIVLQYKSTSLGTYLEKVKKNGNGQPTIKFSPDLLEKLKIGPNDFQDMKIKDTNVFLFETHLDLDELCCYILTIDPDFPENHKFEWALLKGFDRAFWLRYINSAKKKRPNLMFRQKLDEEGVSSCPFGDPQNHSFIQEL